MPAFDSLAVNSYEAGQGICSHTDLLRFQDGIAIVSLLSAVTMDFRYAPASQQPPATAPEMPVSPENCGQPSPQPQAGWMQDGLAPSDGAKRHCAQLAHDNEQPSAQLAQHAEAIEASERGLPAGESPALSAVPVVLESPAASPALPGAPAVSASRGTEQQNEGLVRHPDQVVRLEPGDVLTLHSAARYQWAHGIQAVPDDLWQGEVLQRSRRISLTFRTLSRNDDVLEKE